MKLVDTSIFIYAQGRAHPLRESCRALVAGLAADQAGYSVIPRSCKRYSMSMADEGRGRRVCWFLMPC